MSQSSWLLGTTTYRTLLASICSILCASSVFFGAVSHAHANGATQATLHQQIYHILIEVISIQEHILQSGNFSLVPQTYQLLEQVMQLQSQVASLPPGYASSDTVSDGGPTAPVADQNCTNLGASGGTTDTLDMPNGITVNAIATFFQCQNDVWVTGLREVEIYEGDVQRLQRETSPLIYVGYQNDDPDEGYYRFNPAYEGDRQNGQSDESAIAYTEQDVVEGIEYEYEGDSETWYAVVLRDGSTRAAPYTNQAELRGVVRESGYEGDMDVLLQANYFGGFPQ